MTQVSLFDFLIQKSQDVRELEKQGQTLLRDQGQKAYEDIMRQKATLLAALADDVKKQFGNVGGEQMRRLERFSFNAQTALSIGSVFYMSALLYPEDYEAGEPNDLERLAAEVGQ